MASNLYAMVLPISIIDFATEDAMTDEARAMAPNEKRSVEQFVAGLHKSPLADRLRLARALVAPEWCVVPREPTDKMLTAGLMTSLDTHDEGDELNIAVFQAMLAAAEEPQ